jgi:hypothetical protein
MFAGKTPNSIMAALVPGIVLVVGFLFALKTSAMGSSNESIFRRTLIDCLKNNFYS